jgi:hypothetical protein
VVATPKIRDRVSRLSYLVYSETRASLFGPTAVTASPRPSSYAPRFALGIQIVAKMRPHSRPVGARVQGPVRPTAWPQSTTCRLRFTLSQTRTISAKRVEVHQNSSPRPSPRGTATRRWPVKCRRGHHGVPTRGARAADHGIEDERHARRRALSQAVGPAAEAPRSRVGVGCLSIVRSVATRAGQGQRTSRTLPGVCNFDCQTTRSDHHADERTQEGPRRASRAA